MTCVARQVSGNLPGDVRPCQPGTTRRSRHDWSMRLLDRCRTRASIAFRHCARVVRGSLSTCMKPLQAAAASNLSALIVFLPNDCDIAPGVCGIASSNQQLVQLDKRRQINAWCAHEHPGASHRIEHPAGNGNHDTGRPLHLKKLARRSLLYASHDDRAAKIWMPSIMDFKLLPDMGRMNG